MDTDKSGTLLPITAITPELLNTVAREITEADADGIEPAWWGPYKRVFQKACDEDTGGGVGNALVPSVMDMIEKGKEFGPAMAAKLLVVGWRMAEIYLQQQLEKSAGA